MMTFFSKGNGFKGALAYDADFQHRHDKQITFLGSNGISVRVENPTANDISEIAREFRMCAQMAPNISKPVINLFNTYPDEDSGVLTNKRMYELAIEYLSKYARKVVGWRTISKNGKKRRKPILEQIPIDELQYVIYRHGEKNNQHNHTLLNAVTLKGDTIYLGNDWTWNEKICKEITVRHGLTWGKPKEKSEVMKFNYSDDAIRYDLAGKICDAVEKVHDIHELPSILKKDNVDVTITDDSKGVARGIAFKYKNHPFKGSDLGRRFTASNIIKQIQAVEAAVVGKHPERSILQTSTMLEPSSTSSLTQSRVEDSNCQPVSHAPSAALPPAISPQKEVDEHETHPIRVTAKKESRECDPSMTYYYAVVGDLLRESKDKILNINRIKKDNNVWLKIETDIGRYLAFCRSKATLISNRIEKGQNRPHGKWRDEDGNEYLMRRETFIPANLLDIDFYAMFSKGEDVEQLSKYCRQMKIEIAVDFEQPDAPQIFVRKNGFVVDLLQDLPIKREHKGYIVEKCMKLNKPYVEVGMSESKIMPMSNAETPKKTKIAVIKMSIH